MPVLKVENLKKTYASKNGGNRSKALDGISFGVEKGEFVGIIATSGDVIIGNQNLNMMNSEDLAIFRREKLGFVFQDYNLLDTMTFRENIVLPLVLAKKNPKAIKQGVDRMAVALGIEKLLGKYPYEASGGQRQRASAARTMINSPELILCLSKIKYI